MALLVLLLATAAAAHGQALCPHEAADLQPWSNASSWDSQTVPTGGDVTIDRPILLDISTAPMGKITVTVGGRLVFDVSSDTPLKLTTSMVELTGGELWIGSEDCPYTGDAEVLLTGTRDESNDAPIIQKAVLVREGVLEVHGKPKLAWTRITATVYKTSREELTTGAIYSAVDDDNLRGNGIFLVEFDSSGNRLNWQRVHGPRRFTRLTGNTGNVVAVVVKKKANFGTKFSPEEFSAGFEELCYGGQRTSGLRDMVLNERKAFAAICHIGFPENSVEEVGTVDNGKSLTSLLVQRIGDVEFAAMSIVALSGDSNVHQAEMLSYPAGSAPSLERTLTVADPVDSWQTGDRIVLASTDYHHNQAEEFEVLECGSCTEYEVKIKGPVFFTHWGETTDGVEMQAEVGVLTRNVRFHGQMENTCYGGNKCDFFDYDTFGGQVLMVKGFNAARIENAEFFHMGQQAAVGFYPIHFHMCLDTSKKDVYIRGNSIHNTFSRCLTIHGTHNVTVQDNFAYDHLGHCFFLEDGGEQHNKLIGNLGMGTKPGTILPTDVIGQVSTFWITNPDNELINNHAAGSDGMGIWILMPYFPTGFSANEDMGLVEMQTLRTLIPAFRGNRAHSNRNFGFRLDDILLDDGTVKTAHYKPLVDATDPNSDPAFLHLDDFVAYKNFKAVWITSFWTLCTNFRLAENIIGLEFAGSQPANHGFHYEMLANSRIVGETDNKGEPAGTVTLNSGEVVVLDRSLARQDIYQAQVGMAFYRGPVHVVNTSFSGFKANVVRSAGGIGKKGSNQYLSSPISSVRNVTFDYSDPAEGSRFFDGDGTVHGFTERDGNRHSIVLDADGSLTTLPGTSILRPIPLLMNARCVLMPSWGPGAALCPDRFSRLLFNRAGLIPTFMTRNDLMASETETPLAEQQISYSLNTRESYILHFNSTVPAMFRITPMGLQQGLEQIVSVCVGVDQSFTIKPRNRYSAVQNMEEVKADDSNSKYFYDSAVGVVTFRFTNPYPRGEDTLTHCPGELDEDLNGVCEPLVTITMAASNDDGDCRRRAYPAYRTEPVSADGALTVPVFQ